MSLKQDVWVSRSEIDMQIQFIKKERIDLVAAASVSESEDVRKSLLQKAQIFVALEQNMYALRVIANQMLRD